MLYDQHGYTLDRWEIASGIDIARDRAEDLRLMEEEHRDFYVRKVRLGEMSAEAALKAARRDNFLALCFLPIGAFAAIFSPLVLIFIVSHPFVTLAAGIGLWRLLRKKPQKMVVIECSRCRNLDPANLKGGKFTCTVCGYTMT